MGTKKRRSEERRVGKEIEDQLSPMSEDEWSPFTDEKPVPTVSEKFDWKNDPVWQQRIMRLANGNARIASWLTDTLSDISLTDLSRLEYTVLKSVSDEDLWREWCERMDKKDIWASNEASRIAGDDEPEDMALAMSLKHWIVQYSDEEDFDEDLKRFLTKLPIGELRRGIVERESDDVEETNEIMRERSLMKASKKNSQNLPTGSHRYVLKDKSQLATNIRKNISGKLDNAFRELAYARITKKQLNEVENLKAKFPNASAAIDLLSSTLRRHWQFGDDRIRLRPIILAGEPGTGKTRLCRELAKILDVPVTEGNVGGHMDSQIFGVSGGWSTAFPSTMTTAVAEAKLMNPLIMIDEIDKVRPSQNGDVWAEFLGLLEPTESSTYYEKFLATNVDASGICWIFTANDLSLIPRPFLSRCAVCEVHPPQPDQVRTIVSSLVDDYAKSLGVDSRFLPLTEGDVAYLESTWMEHRSIRVLSELLRHILDESQQHLATA